MNLPKGSVYCHFLINSVDINLADRGADVDKQEDSPG